MAEVKTIHEIVTRDHIYPAGATVVDMPQTLIDEMQPRGAIQVIAETAPVEVIVAAKATKKKGV